jgi:hypothetical protein
MFTDGVLKLRFCAESGSKEIPYFVRLLRSSYQLLPFTLIFTHLKLTAILRYLFPTAHHFLLLPSDRNIIPISPVMYPYLCSRPIHSNHQLRPQSTVVSERVWFRSFLIILMLSYQPPSTFYTEITKFLNPILSLL